MFKMNKIITIASIEKIFKKAGARRVSEEAKQTFRSYIEDQAERLAEKIVRATRNTNRKTVRVKDMIVIDTNFLTYKPIEKEYYEY